VANAGVIIDGTFSGTVYAVGVESGSPLNLSGLVGSTVTGSFSYCAQSLTLVSTGATSSIWTTIGSRNPVTMSVTVGPSATVNAQTYTVQATGVSNLVVVADESGNSNPANQFNLGVSNSLTTPLPPGDTLGSIDIVIANNSLGNILISSLTDPGTVSFSNQSLPASSGQGSSIALVNWAGVALGEINFAITEASAGPAPSGERDHDCRGRNGSF
jgi:hypothetical protein